MSYSQMVADDLARQIREGKALWQNPLSSDEISLSAPRNGSNGRFFTGMAEMRLRAKAQECNFTDPRWATAEQIYTMGWKLKPGAEQSVVTVGFNTIQNGRSQYKYRKVYNAEYIDGIPEKRNVQHKPISKVTETAKVKISDYLNQTDNNELSNKLAKYLLSSETGIPLPGNTRNDQHILNTLQTDKVAFFKSFKEAQRIKDTLISGKSIIHDRPKTREPVQSLGY